MTPATRRLLAVQLGPARRPEPAPPLVPFVGALPPTRARHAAAVTFV